MGTMGGIPQGVLWAPWEVYLREEATLGGVYLREGGCPG